MQDTALYGLPDKAMSRISNIKIFTGVICCFVLSLAAAKPLIYLTPLQSEGLEEPANESQWNVTRKHLHGFWFNNAGNQNSQTRDIILRLEKTNFPIIVPVSFNYDTPELSYNYPAWTKFEEISELLGEEKTLYPTEFLFDSLKVANGEYDLDEGLAAINAAKADPRFSGARSGVTFSPRHGLESPSDVEGQTYFFRAKAMINEIDGMVAIESAPWRMNGLPNARLGFINLYHYAKSRNLKFAWLMNRGVGTENDEWLSDIESALEKLAENNVFPDVIAISNQGDNSVPRLPALPEKDGSDSPVNTLTGALYWLLNYYGWLAEAVDEARIDFIHTESALFLLAKHLDPNTPYTLQTREDLTIGGWTNLILSVGPTETYWEMVLTSPANFYRLTW